MDKVELTKFEREYSYLRYGGSATEFMLDNPEAVKQIKEEAKIVLELAKKEIYRKNKSVEEPISKKMEKAAQKAYPEDIHKQSIFIHGATYAYTHLKNTQPLDEGLEEVSKKYSSCIYLEEVLSDDDKEVLKGRLINTFKAGAKWQKEKDDKLLQDHIVYKKGKESGMRYMKQLLMKDVIELPLYLDGEFLTVDYDFTESGYKVGDKVKLIIIKEE